MSYSSFAFILTDACNYRCSYCYQKRGRRTIEGEVLGRACDFFFPHLSRNAWVTFTGGEPFLAFSLLRRAVEKLEARSRKTGKPLRFSVSTNGSLLSDEVLDFLEKHRFTVLLSFDGYAQETCRKKGSFERMASLLGYIKDRPAISLVTNSVFTPETVIRLADSLLFLIHQDVPRIQLSLSFHQPWDRESLGCLKKELAALRPRLMEFYGRRGFLPVMDLDRAAEPGDFFCGAGLKRMALGPDGTVWGCFLLYDYFQAVGRSAESDSYCFGHLDAYILENKRARRRILENYVWLRPRPLRTPRSWCWLCPDRSHCRLCPVNAAFFSSGLGRVSSSACALSRALIRERTKLWALIDNG
jgi:MoaA/NifB/PqqE/SkfB family radical SAM enzyme